METVDINSISFSSKYSVITANVKTLSNQARITIPYKVDTGHDENIMPFHIIKQLFPIVTKEQLLTREIQMSS